MLEKFYLSRKEEQSISNQRRLSEITLLLKREMNIHNEADDDNELVYVHADEVELVSSTQDYWPNSIELIPNLCL